MALSKTENDQQTSETAKTLEVLQILRDQLPTRDVYLNSSLEHCTKIYNAVIKIAGAKGFVLFQKYKNNLLNGSLIA